LNINIICIGKIKDKYINDGIAEFSKRMTSFVTLNIIELKEYNKEDSINISIEKESSEILKQISSLLLLYPKDGKMVSISLTRNTSLMVESRLEEIRLVAKKGKNQTIHCITNLEL